MTKAAPARAEAGGIGKERVVGGEMGGRKEGEEGDEGESAACRADGWTGGALR